MASVRMKDFTCYAKSISTDAEDAGMQRNLFSSKTTLRIIRNVKTIGVDFLQMTF